MANEHEMGDDMGDVDLSAYATALRSPSVWAPLPADLGGRVIAAVAAERVVGIDEPVATSSEPVARSATTAARRRWIPRVLLPAAAALVLAFGAGLWLGNRDDASVAVDDPADAAAAVTLSGTALGARRHRHRPGLRPRGRVLDPTPRRPPVARPAGRVLRGVAAVGRRRPGERRHVPHARRRRLGRAVVGGRRRRLSHAAGDQADRGPGGVLAAGRALRAGRLRRPRHGRRAGPRPLPAEILSRRRSGFLTAVVTLMDSD